MTVGAPHVVIDVRLERSGGHRTYLHQLVPRLACLTPTWRWTLLGHAPSLTGSAWTSAPNISIVHCGAPIYGIREQLALARAVPGDASLFWAPHYNLPLGVRVPVVVTIHDVAHLRLPEYTRRRLRSAYARLMFSAAVRRAAGIVCVSRFTERELRDVAGTVACPVRVVHQGVDAAWFETDDTPSPMSAPYFVYVGNLKPHKNVGVLLAAIRAVAGKVRERLVIVGTAEGYETADVAVAREIGTMGDRVEVMRSLPEATIRALVRGATALVLPSRYEGFGLPPLEAMAAGVPAIVSRRASLPEVCGDAALYFEPDDANALTRHLESLAADAGLRADFAARGRARARTFTWDATAGATLAALESALTAR